MRLISVLLLAVPAAFAAIPVKHYQNIGSDKYYWSRYGGYTFEEAEQFCKDMGMLLWAPYTREDFNEVDWILGNVSIDIGKHRVLTGWKDVDEYKSTKFIADARPHQTIDGSWGKDQRPEMWGRNQPNAKKKKRINTCITTGGTRWGSGREFWDDHCINYPQLYQSDHFYFLCQKTDDYATKKARKNADIHPQWHFSGFKAFTWMDAREACSQHDMVLWGPKDLYELLSVARQAFDNSVAQIEKLDIWLAWNDFFDEDKREYVDDEGHVLANTSNLWLSQEVMQRLDAEREDDREFSCAGWSGNLRGVGEFNCQDRKAFICKDRGSFSEFGKPCRGKGKKCRHVYDCCFGNKCDCITGNCMCVSSGFNSLEDLLQIVLDGSRDDEDPFKHVEHQHS